MNNEWQEVVLTFLMASYVVCAVTLWAYGWINV